MNRLPCSVRWKCLPPHCLSSTTRSLAWSFRAAKMMQVQVPPGVVGGQIMTVQVGAQLVQVQVPPGLVAGQSFQIKAPEPQVPMMLQVQVPAGVSPGQMIQVQTPNGPLQVQVPEGALPGGMINVQAPGGPAPVAPPAVTQPAAPAATPSAATPIDGAAAEAPAAPGTPILEVQRVLKPRVLAERASRLQRYLMTVPAPLLQKGPALENAIRRCPCAPLGRGSDA